MMCFTTILFSILYVHYALSQYFPAPNEKTKHPCESSTQGVLIEQFFNIIFTEFDQSLPVCVCVQMCSGQSTYCYPNGCLKRDNVKRDNAKKVDSHQSTLLRSDASNFMLVDAENDMGNFIMKDYSEQSKTPPPIEPKVDMRLGLFKDKYKTLFKFKKMPNIKLKYNLREQVKYMKADQVKTDTLEFSKTRWPLNKHKLGRGKKIPGAPLLGKTNVFMSMLPGSQYAEYTPKYSKRDIVSTLSVDDPLAKSLFLYENDNNTDNGDETAISLETLIDNLIKKSIRIKPSENSNTEPNFGTENQTENNTIVVERSSDVHVSTIVNTTLDVISLNLTNEIVDMNKYSDDTSTSINKFNDMIKNLSKRIDVENNTSLELAKRIVSDFDKDSSMDVTNKPNIIIAETSTVKINQKDIINIGINTTTVNFKKSKVNKSSLRRVRSNRQEH